MLRIQSEVFLVLSKMAGALEGSRLPKGFEKADEMLWTPLDEKDPDFDFFIKVAAQCNAAGLVVSAAGAERIHNKLREGATHGEMRELYHDLYMRLRDEFAGRFVWTIEPAKVHLFTQQNLFDTSDVKVSVRFPQAIRDIEEAGKCLALDRGTACVFHLMRVLEIGLQELGEKLRVVLPSPNWQDILNAVNGAVKRLPRTTPEEKAFLAKASEAALQLQHVKDAWRNDVMHPRDVYTQEEAEDVFDTSRRLMRTLAGWL